MLFFRLLEISVIHPAKCKLPSIREICICMLVYAYENEVLKKYSIMSKVTVHSIAACIYYKKLCFMSTFSPIRMRRSIRMRHFIRSDCLHQRKK